MVLKSPLLLASSNAGKLREFADAASERGLRVKALPGMNTLPACVEDGQTFEENARKKALHYSAYASGPVFADDSGICVEALGGMPGVFSARFSGPGATDDENNAKLLRELHRVEAALPPTGNLTRNRAAHYVCVIVLAQRGRVLHITEGRAEGIILDEPKGTGGFGYDPYFFYPPFGKTFAELQAEEKFAVSHRGEAFRRLLDLLSKG